MQRLTNDTISIIKSQISELKDKRGEYDATTNYSHISAKIEVLEDTLKKIEETSSYSEYESVLDGSEFHDMKKYNPDFREDLIKGKSDNEIREIFKDYYNNHLPIDLLTWMRVFEPSNMMDYKQGYFNQTVFVRDNINGIINPNARENPVLVIATHKSKSIELPVYYIYLERYNTQIIMRNNFYNWMISVDSPYQIEGIENFFSEKEPIKPLYCEGFKPAQVFGMYKDNNKHFTVELNDDNYIAYTFFFMLRKSLDKRVK